MKVTDGKEGYKRSSQFLNFKMYMDFDIKQLKLPSNKVFSEIYTHTSIKFLWFYQTFKAKDLISPSAVTSFHLKVPLQTLRQYFPGKATAKKHSIFQNWLHWILILIMIIFQQYSPIALLIYVSNTLISHFRLQVVWKIVSKVVLLIISIHLFA